MTVTRIGPSATRSRRASIRLRPATVSFATTSTCRGRAAAAAGRAGSSYGFSLIGQSLIDERVEGVWGNREVPPQRRRRGPVGETWFPPRERAKGEQRSRLELPLAAFHPFPVLVAEQVQEAVHERAPPGVADHLRTDDDVAELARNALRKLLATVDRKGEHVRLLVHPEVLALQLPHASGPLEADAEIAFADALGRQDAAAELGDGRLVDRRPAPVLELDPNHRRRCVPVCSAWCLYASTIRCTRTWRTTSWCPNSTNSIPSIVARISRTWIRPEAWSAGRSTWVTSPVTTTLDPKPSRVRNICICSGVVFCASSRMMNESLRVRPRMKARGATSIVPFSM